MKRKVPWLWWVDGVEPLVCATMFVVCEESLVEGEVIGTAGNQGE